MLLEGHYRRKATHLNHIKMKSSYNRGKEIQKSYLRSDFNFTLMLICFKAVDPHCSTSVLGRQRKDQSLWIQAGSGWVALHSSFYLQIPGLPEPKAARAQITNLAMEKTIPNAEVQRTRAEESRGSF